jgi:hypothetical protein
VAVAVALTPTAIVCIQMAVAVAAQVAVEPAARLVMAADPILTVRQD